MCAKLTGTHVQTCVTGAWVQQYGRAQVHHTVQQLAGASLCQLHRCSGMAGVQVQQCGGFSGTGGVMLSSGAQVTYELGDACRLTFGQNRSFILFYFFGLDLSVHILDRVNSAALCGMILEQGGLLCYPFSGAGNLVCLPSRLWWKVEKAPGRSELVMFFILVGPCSGKKQKAVLYPGTSSACRQQRQAVQP